MAFDETLDQLCFGRSTPKMESCLGLYLSPEVLFLAEVKGAGRPQLTHLVRIPVEGAQADPRGTRTVGTLNTDFLSEHSKVTDLLQKAMQESRWEARHVVVTLSHHFGILRFFGLPAIDRRFWKTAVPAEAKKYVPIPFANLSYDFQTRDLKPGPDRRPRLGALFGVTNTRNLQNVRQIVSQMGWELVGAELAPCSVERLWDALDGTDGAAYARVHFDGGHVRILISDMGVPVFFRELFLPADATVLDRRKVDLAGCVDFTRKQIGVEELKSIRLSGSLPDLKTWRDAFAQDLGQKVDIEDTDKALGIRGGQWGGYSAAGAAMRYLVPTALTLDLGGVGKISDEDRRVAYGILTLSSILALLLAGMGVYHYVGGMLAARQLAAIQADAEVYEAFAGKSAEEIRTVIDDMRQRSSSLGIFRSAGSLTRVFEALAEHIPDSAWLETIEFENKLGGDSPTASQVIRLAGRTSDQSRAAEQEVVYRFWENLKREKRFAGVFRTIGQTPPSVQVPPTESSGGEAPTLEQRLNQGTQFRIEASSREGQSP